MVPKGRSLFAWFLYFVCVFICWFAFFGKKKRWIVFDQKKSVSHGRWLAPAQTKIMGNTPFWASTKPFPVTRANTNYLPPLWRSALNQCKAWTHWPLGSSNLLTSTYPPHFTQEERTQRLTSLPYLVSSRTTQTMLYRSRLMGGTVDSPSSAATRTHQLAGQKSKFTWQFTCIWQFTNKWRLCPSLSNAVKFF